MATAARPSYCPAVNATVDPCEMQYSVDIPVLGRDTVGIPITRIVGDALTSATAQLPSYLPAFYQELMPYVNQMRDSIWGDVQALAPDLVQQVLDEQVIPQVNKLEDDVVGKAQALGDELMAVVLAAGAATLIAVGVGVWYLKQSR
jgi:hypothetical protein